MKSSLFLIAALLATIIAKGAIPVPAPDDQTVTQQEALRRAAHFLATRHGADAAKGMRQPRKEPQLKAASLPSPVSVTPVASVVPAAPVAPEAPETPVAPPTPYYIFNVDSTGGFVIVSADDRTPAILGYADSGTFDPGSLPDNFRALLDDYAEQIATLPPRPLCCDRVAAPAAPAASQPRKAPVIRRSVAPLLTTTWNQNAPYNRLVLDTLQYSDVCFTGCVATAMAQLLNYHAQRTGRPVATTAYIPAYITGNIHYRVNAVEQGTSIDWANMQDSYLPTATIRTEQQRRQADAVAQLMHFCGASVRMNYGKTASGADSWRVPDALKTYFGYDQALRMADRYDYTYSQWMDLVYGELAEQRPVYITGASSGGGHAFIIDGFDGDEMFHFNWGWGGHCNGYYLLSLSNPTDKKGIGAGDSDDGYTMRQGAIIGAQPESTVPVVIPDPPQQPSGNVSLQLLSLTYDGTPTAKRPLKVSATIRNDGDEFYGNVHFFTKRVGLVLTDTCSVGVTLMKGQTQTLEFTFTPPEARDYEARLFTDIPAVGDLYASTITVVAAKPTSNDVDLLIDMQLSKLDATGKYIVGNKVHMKTTISNNTGTDYEGILMPILLVPGGLSYQLERRVVEAYSTVVVEDDYDVSVEGRYIPVCITDIPNRMMVYQPNPFYYYVKPSVTIYYADGSRQMIEASSDMTIPSDAVAVDLRGNEQTRYLKPSSNPNCLYFLSADIHTPSGLANNVVKGSSCKMLTLTDNGMPFMPIADFTADSVVYTRTFDSGMTTAYAAQCTAGVPSWTTLCLPFTADRCLLADGTGARWMKHEDDMGYDFWLMEFIGDEHGTLFFAPAKELRAYTPYLVNVPGAGMTGYRDMTSTPISFCGRKATVRATASSVAASTRFKFVGTMVDVNDESDAYAIDTDGRQCRRNYVSARPFRAYVKAVSNTSPADIVPMSIAAFSAGQADRKGDVNADGAVNVADISAVTSVMAGFGTGSDPERADVNGDGEVNVADISAIITIMAGN